MLLLLWNDAFACKVVDVHVIRQRDRLVIEDYLLLRQRIVVLFRFFGFREIVLTEGYGLKRLLALALSRWIIVLQTDYCLEGLLV